MVSIILASNSPRRKEMFNQLGIDYQVVTANDTEEITTKTLPFEVVLDLSQQKAQATLKLVDKSLENIIIAADTVVAFHDKILGKPKNKEDAYRMISSLSGNTHTVYTGFTILNSKQNNIISDYEKTDVTFYELSHSEIEKYINTNEPYDKAGGYGIQGMGSYFVKHIQGDYLNVVGLPMSKLLRVMKNEFNLEGVIENGIFK